VVQSFSNPQTLNRYSYCVNNPLKYTDPSGNVLIAYDEGGNYKSKRSNDVHVTSKTPIVDAVAPVNGGFIITSGLVPVDSWWGKTTNIFDKAVRLFGSAFGVPGSGLSDSPADIGVSGNVVAYHTSSGSTGVVLNLSSSADMKYSVTLNWMANNEQKSLPMKADESYDGINFVRYSNNYKYEAYSTNTLSGTGTTSFLYQPQLNLPFTPNSVTVPNYNNKSVQSMWVTISPQISQSSNPSACISFSRPQYIKVPIK
jgi:YD repeat-containing protein